MVDRTATGSGAIVDAEADGSREHSAPDRELDGPSPVHADGDPAGCAVEGDAPSVRRWGPWRSVRAAVVIGIALVLLGGALAAWQGRIFYQAQAQLKRDEALLSAARQGALNLTTIDFNQVDADVARILDSSTGAFRDDFERRSQPFSEVVKEAKSTSVGSITEAALESSTSTHGQALVAVSVQTSDASGEQQPRLWRMRVSVDQTDQGIKVSNVEFVP
ncbi:hypothetical protein [Mycolicibacterium vaccae]|uniref:hypothetical protein n=1 Tax=Mycolicibacterium vaccae TaxID=1810 RepID=UPI003CFC8D69